MDGRAPQRLRSTTPRERFIEGVVENVEQTHIPISLEQLKGVTALSSQTYLLLLKRQAAPEGPGTEQTA